MCCRPPASTRGCPGRWRGEMAGTLYVVATPLGNLGDLSPRAAETLRGVAVVAAEDTRHTKTLLAHVGSGADLLSVHAHSSAAALRRVLHLLGAGKDVALVTDAGTPSVSDPGAELVAAARARDVPVVAGAGRPAREERPPDPEERARALLAQGMTRKDVADRLAAETGITRNTAYRLVNEL